MAHERFRYERGARHALVALVMALATMSGAVSAQQDARMRLRIGPVVLAETSKETPFQIAVEPADTVPPRSFVRIRGLPATVALSDGHVLAAGIWAVPLRALSDLRLIVPEGTAQRTPVTVSLVGLDGSVIVETTTELVVAPPVKLSGQIPAQGQVQPPATQDRLVRANTIQGLSPLGGPLAPPQAAPAPIPAPPPAPRIELPPAVPQSPPALAAPLPAPTEARTQSFAALPPAAQPAQPSLAPAPSLSASDRQRLQRLVERGDEQLSEGAVAAARLLYTRAADAGLAQAALALGATYDPAELARLKVIGINPDVAAARAWYQKAQALGAPEAISRLKRLEGR